MLELFEMKYNEFYNKTGVRPNKCYISRNAFSELMKEYRLVKENKNSKILFMGVEIAFAHYFSDTRMVFIVV